MADIIDILQTNGELNENQLKKYLAGDVSKDEVHSIEKQMANSEFINDAVEGLQAFSSTKHVDEYVSELNKKLHQQLTSKKYKDKRKMKDLTWIIIAVIIILLLCVFAFVVVRMQTGK
jgi:hypothetical protein